MKKEVESEHPDRRLELKVGAFVLLAIVAGLGVVALLGNKHHVFESRVTLHTSFAEVGGLREGAPVWLSGVNVGTVTRVAVGRAGEKVVRVDVEVARTMLDRIHQDSVATIGSQGLLGDKIIEISIGSTMSPQLEAGSELQTTAPADFNKLMDQAAAILDRAKTVADNAAIATHELADPHTIANFRGAMGSVRALLKQAETGPGLAHALFYDQRTSDQVGELVTQVNRLATRVDSGVKRLDAILDATDGDGKQVINNLSRAAKDVGTVAQSVQRTKMIANLESASGDVALIARNVRSGQGTVGALLVDPTVYEQLVTVLGGVQRSRVLRALVRFAIARDEGRTSSKVIEGPRSPAALPGPLAKEDRKR